MKKSLDNDKSKRDRLVLIDGHSLLFRAFHAYPPLTTKSGELVNAVYGFSNILLSVIKELEPTHLAVSFDRDEPTFRHEEFEGYKASRPETPEELVVQQDRVREIVDILNIPIYEKPGFEADDVIGTLASQAVEQPSNGGKELTEVVIVTSDRDILQLVDDSQVKVYMPGKGKKMTKVWDAEEVSEIYGLNPEQLIEMKALAGDASDEIPGIKGVGPKTATKLLVRYGNLETIYKNLEDVREEFGESLYKKLVEGKKSAEMSKKLATIVRDVPVKLSFKKCEIHDYNKGKAVEKLEELEFKSLIKKLPSDSFEKMVQEELLEQQVTSNK